MNAKNRKQISQLLTSLSEIKQTIDDLMEDEQQKFDNMPEGIQDSERGEAMQNAIDSLEYASQSVEEAIDNLTDID